MKKIFVRFEQWFFSFVFIWCSSFLRLFKNYFNCSLYWLWIKQWRFFHIDMKMSDQIRDHYFDSSFIRSLFTQFWKILFHTDLKIKNWNVLNCIHLSDAFINIFCFWWDKTFVHLLFIYYLFIYLIHRYDIDQGLIHAGTCYFRDIQEKKSWNLAISKWKNSFQSRH